jgi:PAS domain S-box-containing protein
MSTASFTPISSNSSVDWQRVAWEDAADAKVLSDPNGLVLAANRAYYALYGYGPDQVIGQSFAVIFPPEARPWAIEQYHAIFTADVIPPLIESTVRRADGEERIVETRINFIQAGGQRVAMQSTIRDITARKAAEQAAERSAQAQLQDVVEELRALAADLQWAREDERRHLARELHDELGNVLTGLNMSVDQLGKLPAARDPNVQMRLKDMAAQIERTIKVVRRLATDLRPAVLDDLGLLAAIEWQLQEFQARSGVASQFQSVGEALPLNPDQAIALYRIVQESLTNVARHAEARQVTVSLSEADGHVVVRIQDDGRGFDPAKMGRTGSFGLAGMRERAHALAGRLAIESTPGGGTTVVVSVPLGTATP